MSDALRIQQIRQFVMTAADGSFKAAADATFRSQSAVSIAMHELEAQIGAPLFEKGRRACLTPLARTLLPLFQELLATHDRVLRNARQYAQAERGSVTIAVAPSLSEKWLPPILKKFADAHPQVMIRAIDEPSQLVRSLVASGEADFGIGGLYVEDPALHYLPIAEDIFGVVCAPSHRFARRRRPVGWSELEGERLIGNATFETLRGRGLDAWIQDPVLTITNRTSLNACVRSGLGITLLPTIARPSAETGLVFVPLAEPRIFRLIGLIRRADQTLPPASAEMVDLVLGSLGKFARRCGATLVEPAEKL